MEIKVIGLGGIGTWLSRALCMFLQYEHPEASVTLIDGDSYEEQNRSRQLFGRFGNKAEVAAEECKAGCPGLYVQHEACYVTRDNIYSLLYNGDIVFLCVDNHTTRKLVSDYGENLADVTVISGGNDLTTGTVQLFIRRKGSNITMPLANEFHPEIQKPTDAHPLAGGCQQMLPRTPQVVFANITAASMMLNAFYAVVQGKLDGVLLEGKAGVAFDAYFDIVTGSCKTYRREPT